MKHILLVEDNVLMSENTAEILELNGYKVSTAFNGIEGVRKAKALEPDLILCDIMMPEMDGYTVAYTLKQGAETESIPLIFLTAKAEKSDVRKGMQLGADDYLTKPYSNLELLSAIETRLKKIIPSENVNHSILDLSYKEGELLKSLKILIDEKAIKLKKYKKKELLYTEGANPSQIYLVKSGLVKIYKPIGGDRDLLSHFVYENHLLGVSEMMLNQDFKNYAVAQTDTLVYPISKDLWGSLLVANPSLLFNIINTQREHKIYIESKLVLNAFKSVRKRVATALLELQSIFSNQLEKEFIHISREDLANFVGVSPETVIRTLSDFKKHEQIVIESGKIKVLDFDYLQKIRN